ncbi:MAG: tetratricopeptide repeat protein, partial [Betaproteobacteria bacterium]
LLTDGSRTALPRQQTLRATLDWSYGLLSEKERMVLRRASVFLGGFSLEAAVGVAADEAIHASEFGELIAQLVARSLLIVDTTEAAPRYRMLETTRAYARAKLDEARETATLQRRHAEYFCQLVVAAADAWLRCADADWRARYLPEIDNVRGALEWSLGLAGDAALAVGLAGGSGPMWTALSLYGEGAQRLEAASAHIASNASLADQARLWLWLGVLSEAWAPTRALAAFERAADLYRTLDDAQGLGQSLTLLAHARATLGSFQASADALQEALPALDRSGLPKLRAFYFANAGFLKTQTNDLANARTLYETALSLYREAGSEFATAASLNNLANVSWALGDLEAAENAFREAVVMHRNSGHRGKDPLGFVLANLAGVLIERGKLSDALDTAREGLPLLSGAGNAWSLIDHVALRAALAGQLANAARVAGFTDTAHAAKECTRQPNEARARERLQKLLTCHFDAMTLDQYLAEGGRMSEAEACRMALE